MTLYSKEARACFHVVAASYTSGETWIQQLRITCLFEEITDITSIVPGIFFGCVAIVW